MSRSSDIGDEICVRPLATNDGVTWDEGSTRKLWQKGVRVATILRIR